MTLPIVYENLQRVYIYVTIFLALHSIVAFLEQGALSIEQFFYSSNLGGYYYGKYIFSR